MKKGLGYLFLSAILLVSSLACNKPFFAPSLPSLPTPTPTPYIIPTTTPGCYSAASLPITQYAYPNPMPSATPFWTPIVGVPTMTKSGYADDGSYGTVLLRSASDWSSYWADMGQSAPVPPTNFSNTMVLVTGTYGLSQVCYTGTNVVVYQQSGEGGTEIGPLNPPVSIGTSPTPTPPPTATPTPVPSTLPRNLYLIPASSLPVSFVSTYIFGV
jgi:hypothetical protein